ncbi:MAG: flagellar hook assembly protein FlgD, partial [Paracoccaceae bacterium]|nr:flagellar hook assembly protein FlgD [Paracoccaceae bacterium]
MTTAVQPTPTTSNTTPASQAGTSGALQPETSSASPSADYTMFLKMLTTQLKNQDPMNPMDSSNFAVQLATFSGVEQQTQTNKLLGGIAGQIGSMGMAQLSGWIGMQVRAAAATAFDGTPITLSPAPEKGADRTVLIVKDSGGRQVASQDVPVSGADIQWDGQGAAGSALPKGTYSFELQNYKNGVLIGTDPVQSYAKVVEAQ